MKEHTFTLGRRTILDVNAPEYHWVQMLHADGMEKEAINTTIIRCLGGDLQIADVFRQVALSELPPAALLKLIVPEDCLWE
ncbi:hypothetical protein GCE9029_02100 [Grimontia celer]|uniref:Uncharacterized protein n=1 Tax=Grimontia celer TaxID=1796497 RepID=A0A128F1H2_9GAMM|nr:hypothetical protein [Grimontia celer]CZF80619.1 hypothetical protein GCE9029_02100 [Grimontia celer]